MEQNRKEKIQILKNALGLPMSITSEDFFDIILFLPYSEYDLMNYIYNTVPPAVQSTLTPPNVPFSSIPDLPWVWEPGDGSIEFGLFAYWLINPDLIQNATLRNLIQVDLVDYINSEISPFTLNGLATAFGYTQMNTAYFNLLNNVADPLVYTDGSILSTGTFATYDQNWFGAFYNLMMTIKNQSWAYETLPVPSTTNQIPLTGSVANQVTIAMMGDWGTGNYSPVGAWGIAAQVMVQMMKLNPDYMIHLGDVYYSGTPLSSDTNGTLYINPGEEAKNLVSVWPRSHAGKSFTLNSNHEMYTGANGYFMDALNANSTPAGTGSPFNAQNGLSCFALNYGGWTILGLDSAFYSDITSAFMYGSLDSDDNPAVQTPWIQSLGLTAEKTIVLSHHTGFAFDCSSVYSLWADVNNALNGNDPYAWYWGHVHNAIVYQSPLAIPATSGTPALNTNTYARCLGHGALPYGLASSIVGNAGVEWQETNQLDANTDLLANGFVLLTLTLDPDSKMLNSITETFYDISSPGQPVFTKVIYQA